MPSVMKKKKVFVSSINIEKNLCRREQTTGTNESSDGHGGAEHGGGETTTYDEAAESNVHHLSSVAGPASVDESIGVVCAGELGAFWDRDLEEIAERLPAVSHAVLEKLALGDHGADLLVVGAVLLLSVLLEVATEEDVPELCKGCQWMTLDGNMWWCYSLFNIGW